jgi:oxygen-dependent protoporphyrinogen oxidase
MPAVRDVVVVGAGPAGLAHAFWHLREHPGDRLTVLESAAVPGGWVRSERVDGYLCEHGPQALRPSPGLDEMLAAISDLPPVTADPRARQRWIGRGGRLLAVPGGPGQLLATSLLSLPAKLRLIGERWVRAPAPASESVAAFAQRRFGARTVPLVQAVVRGIFAGDAERLEVSSAFPELAAAEREHGSVMRGLGAARRAGTRRRGGLISFAGGLHTLCARLAAVLGDRLRTRSGAVGVTRDGDRFAVHIGSGALVHADRLVLACPARAAAPLLTGIDPALAGELAAIPFASLASVWLGGPLPSPPPRLQGFGFLLEPGEPGPVLGALYCSQLFPDHAPPGHALVRVMLGGVPHADAVDREDAELIAAAEAALRRYTGVAAAWPFRRVVRVRAAIPQYELGHGARVRSIEQRLAGHPGLVLCGNSYRNLALGGQLGRGSGALPTSGL